MTGRALEVRYLSRSKSEMHDFILHPQGIVVRYRVTYLLAMAGDYDDVRQFALNRIHSARISEQPGRVNPGFRLQAYVHSGAFGYPMSPEPVVLRARVRPAVAWLLRETPLSESQVLSAEADAGGWYQLEARVPDDRQTQWWLQSMGAEIDVLEPRAWRDAIHRQARQILGQETGEAK
ncbi:WYL domain-containing protein [Hahella sp. SMD15-11]|uniref:WYL domain-containing protein n=1 Tax=Thermohahella caldifontis TaxID=3142973 RepID=A0AB39US99_9GAMM